MLPCANGNEHVRPDKLVLQEAGLGQQFVYWVGADFFGCCPSSRRHPGIGLLGARNRERAKESGGKTPPQNSNINNRNNSNNMNEQPAINNIYDELMSVDYVPPNLPKPNGRAKLVLLEDNDPVIQICIKGRNPTLRHMPRIHRVNIDATYERIREDPCDYMRYWPKQYQLADILTKPSFTGKPWKQLLVLLQIRRESAYDRGDKTPQVKIIRRKRRTPHTEPFEEEIGGCCGLAEGKSILRRSRSFANKSFNSSASLSTFFG